MIAYRVVLAGKSSGLREIIESIVEDQSDMALVNTIDSDSVSEADWLSTVYHEFSYAIRENQANVLIVEGDASTDKTLNMDMLLEEYPNILMICLTSFGKRIGIHSEICLDGIGVYQFINAIRALGVNKNYVMYQ